MALVLTNTDLCNLALGHVAARPIVTFEENSKEAEWCRTYYTAALGYVLADHDWKFASFKWEGVKIELDTVVDGPTSADLDGWTYLYEIPAEIVKVREVLTANQMQQSDPYGYGNVDGAAFGVPSQDHGFHVAPSNSYTLSNERGFGDNRGPEIPFNVSAIRGKRYIFCDVDNARFRGTKNFDDVIAYPPEFSLLFSFYLAYLFAFPITRKFEVRATMLKTYEDMKGGVQANNMNEQTQINRDPPAPWVRARQGD